VNSQVLIDSVVRQTTVLIAQLATAGGVRAPLAHMANQVFLELTRALHEQGVSRKVSADMFGMAFRAYLRKIQRLTESSTYRGHSLWEAVLSYIGERPMVSRHELLERFARDEPLLVRGVLHDLTESGLVFCSGSGPTAVYRAVSPDELQSLRSARAGSGLDELLWAVIYREGPMAREALLERTGGNPIELDATLSRLQDAARIQKLANGSFASSEFVVPIDAEVGWEAAVFDHYHALVKTICARLSRDPEAAVPASAIGGSTYTFNVWPGHPHYEEAIGILDRYRTAQSELRERVERHNAQAPMPARSVQVVAYAGQSALIQEGQLEGQNDRA
jgi:hypothetical protein